MTGQDEALSPVFAPILLKTPMVSDLDKGTMSIGLDVQLEMPCHDWVSVLASEGKGSTRGNAVNKEDAASLDGATEGDRVNPSGT